MENEFYIGRVFDSFDDFIELLNDYSKQSYSIWKKFNSKKIDEENGTQYKFVHLKCVYHRDEKDITTKSKGTRPIQGYVAPCNCLTEIRVNYVISGRHKDKYEITKCDLKHQRINKETKQLEEAHRLNQEDYAKHPSNRRLTEEEEREIYEHFETGGDAKMIAMTMSQKTNKWLTTRDMWNVRNKLSKKNITKDDHPLKAFENVMNERIKIDNHNNFKLVYDEVVLL